MAGPGQGGVEGEVEGEVEERRLLAVLGETGGFGRPSPFGCGRVALYREKAGARLGAGFVAAALVERLVAAGRLRWQGEGQAARLELAPVAEPQESRPAFAEVEMVVDGQARRVLLDERESPLLWLHRRRGRDGAAQISEGEFAAGERFRRDIESARMLPRTTMNWAAALTPDERSPGMRGPAEASDAALAARARVERACERLGPELSGLAIDVCGFLKGLDQVERERGWPARSAKVVLRLALAALEAHYAPAPAGPRRGSAVWRAEDARPDFPS